MAYIPPHKRHSKASERPFPVPDHLPVSMFKGHVNLRSPKNLDKSGNIVYADKAIHRLLVVGLDALNQLPSSVHFEPVSIEAFEQELGEKPLVLVNSHPSKENDEKSETLSSTEWEYVAVNVWPPLLSSFEIMRKKVESKEFDEAKPAMVVRFGKILFYGSRKASVTVSTSECARKDQLSETSLSRMSRRFKNTTPSYMENIVSNVVTKIGLHFEQEKKIYHIKLSDSTQPISALLCKCRLKDDKKLELYKVELNPVRQMVIDISCIDKNLDLRLAIYPKRIISALTDDEMQSIRSIVDSAIVDPEVKGGLRWPMGKGTSGDRFAVIGVCHTIANKYKSPSLNLKASHVDRFDFKLAIGEASMEVVLKLKRLASDLLEEKVEMDSIFNMFKENLKMIWDHFLCRELRGNCMSN